MGYRFLLAVLLGLYSISIGAQQTTPKKEKFDFSDIDFEEAKEDEWQDEDDLERDQGLEEEWSSKKKLPTLGGVDGSQTLDSDLKGEDDLDEDLSGLDDDLEDDDDTELIPEDDSVSDGDLAGDDDEEGELISGSDGEIPLALQESLDDPMAEEISRLFFRVPLKPPMGEPNWKKWAGPALEKMYVIKPGDNLWTISERFFGTPFLWPKIWQLNAYLGNPNIVEPGMVIKFDPGNPFAGPNLAFKLGESEVGYLPPLVQEFENHLNKKTFEEELMDIQPSTDIRSFYVSELPNRIGRLPDKAENGFIYSEQNEFDIFDIEDGIYRVIRYNSVSGGYHLKVIGVLKVIRSRAKIIQSHESIFGGDYLVKESFALSNVTPFRHVLGEDLSARIRMVPLESEHRLMVADFMYLGLRFPNMGSVPSEGAVLTIQHGGTYIGRAMVIKRQENLATALVIESKREINDEDFIL